MLMLAFEAGTDPFHSSNISLTVNLKYVKLRVGLRTISVPPSTDRLP